MGVGAHNLTNDEVEAIRKEFEEWAVTDNYNICRSTYNSYLAMITRHAWDGWLACKLSEKVRKSHATDIRNER